VLALLILPFALYLGVALTTNKAPDELERRVVMLGFCLLTPALISQALSPSVLAVLTLYSKYHLV